MSKMFKTVTQTINPFTGCKFDCSYCWAKKLALGKCKYPNFEPTFHPDRMKKFKTFKAEDFVFVSSMGDISWIKNEEMVQIADAIDVSPARFLIQTKNPRIFIERGHLFNTPNMIHGCTIETNRPITVSLAPEPLWRYNYIAADAHPHKFLSIEPIMDFDLDVFTRWVIDINPEVVEIGADNYHNNLPEPSPEKLGKFLHKLELAGVNVKRKDGLARLLEDK